MFHRLRATVAPRVELDHAGAGVPGFGLVEHAPLPETVGEAPPPIHDTARIDRDVLHAGDVQVPDQAVPDPVRSIRRSAVHAPVMHLEQLPQVRVRHLRGGDPGQCPDPVDLVHAGNLLDRVVMPPGGARESCHRTPPRRSGHAPCDTNVNFGSISAEPTTWRTRYWIVSSSNEPCSGAIEPPPARFPVSAFTRRSGVSLPARKPVTIAGRALFGAGSRNQVVAALLPVFSSRFGSTTRVTAPATGFCDTDTLPSAAVVRISEAVRISRAWNSRVGGTTSTRFGRTSGRLFSSFFVDRAWIAS